MKVKNKNYIYAILATLFVFGFGAYILVRMDEVNYLKILGVALALFTYIYIWKYINKKNIR